MSSHPVLVTTSWDDGHPKDFKIAELLNKYGLKGTFYFPLANNAKEIMTREQMREIAMNFDIGGHSRNHVNLCQCKNLEDEVAGAKTELQEIMGRRITSFCYPMGRFNSRVQRAVQKAGFEFARTTWEFHEQFIKGFNLPTSLQAFPHKISIRILHCVRTGNYPGAITSFSYFGKRSWRELAKALFDRSVDTVGVWHLWGHSWEIDQFALWDELEEIFAYVTQEAEFTAVSNLEVIHLRRNIRI